MNIEQLIAPPKRYPLVAVPRLQQGHRYARSLPLLLGISVLCTACSTWRQADQTLDKVVNRTDSSRADLTTAQARPAYAVKDTRLTIATRSVPLSREATLPDAMRQVAFRFPGRYSVATIVERIASETGVPMLLTPDALMPASRFAVGGTAGEALAAAALPLPGAAARGRAGEKSAVCGKSLSDLNLSSPTNGNTV